METVPSNGSLLILRCYDNLFWPVSFELKDKFVCRAFYLWQRFTDKDLCALLVTFEI